MDDSVVKLQGSLTEVELIAEKLFLSKQKLVDFDRHRNGNREALTTLRKQARIVTAAKKPALIQEVKSTFPGHSKSFKEDAAACPTCGDYDGSTPVWMAFPGVEAFVRLPYHKVHRQIESDQEQIESTINSLRSDVKEKAMVLSERGAIADKIGPNLMKALVTLKDKT
eukprot:jgi/Mesen1/6735/ME000344S06011